MTKKYESADLSERSLDGLVELAHEFAKDDDPCRALYSIWFLLQEVKEREAALSQGGSNG